MRYISINKFCSEFDISATMVRRSIVHGILKSKRFGKKLMIDAEDFQEKLEDNLYENLSTSLLRKHPEDINLVEYLIMNKGS